jgi:hypothetical protein
VDSNLAVDSFSRVKPKISASDVREQRGFHHRFVLLEDTSATQILENKSKLNYLASHVKKTYPKCVQYIFDKTI